MKTVKAHCALAGTALAALLGATKAVRAGVEEFTDRDTWFAAVEEVVTTVGFTGFAAGTIITDQFEDVGVLFTDGDDFVAIGESFFPQDGHGLAGKGEAITLALTTPTPQTVIGMDFPNTLTISLLNDGELIFTSSEFGIGPGFVGNFAGLISTEPFDTVLLEPVSFIDDLHYVAGPLTPCAVGGTCEAAELFAPGGLVNDRLGNSVSVWDDVLLAGAPRDNNIWGADAGAAYAFRSLDGSDFTFEQKLLPPDAATSDWFGHAVAVAGDVLAVAAPFHDDMATNAGAVWIYRHVQGQWELEQKLVAPDAEAYDDFGWSLALEPGPPMRLAVGAAFDDDSGFDAGSVYVFRFEEGPGWVLEQKLLAGDGEVLDNFGISVALDGGDPLRLVAGAYNDDDNGFDAGAAYVFRYDEVTSQWQQEQKLLAGDGEAEDQFGSAVSLSGNAALVGSAWDDDNGDSAGSAYVFRYDESTSQWQQEQKLLADDVHPAGDKFGFAVALDGPSAVIGAFLDDENEDDAGAAYLFDFDGETWVQREKLLAADDVIAHFGIAVGTWRQEDSLRLAVGAPFEREDPALPRIGAAYVFNRAPGPGDFDCDGRVGVEDFLDLLDSWGPCAEPQEDCPPDLDCNGTVGTADFLTLLQSWGP